MGAAVERTRLSVQVPLPVRLPVAVENGDDSGIRLLSGQGLNKFAGCGISRPAVLIGSMLRDRQPSMIRTLPMDHDIDRVTYDLGQDLDNHRKICFRVSAVAPG
jgi:hypothetical protein